MSWYCHVMVKYLCTLVVLTPFLCLAFFSCLILKELPLVCDLLLSPGGIIHTVSLSECLAVSIYCPLSHSSLAGSLYFCPSLSVDSPVFLLFFLEVSPTVAHLFLGLPFGSCLVFWFCFPCLWSLFSLSKVDWMDFYHSSLHVSLHFGFSVISVMLLFLGIIVTA